MAAGGARFSDVCAVVMLGLSHAAIRVRLKIPIRKKAILFENLLMFNTSLLYFELLVVSLSMSCT